MIVVSACLAGKACRYDGGACSKEHVLQLTADKEAVMICPELAGGLPVPREPAEIIGGTGEDVLDGKARVLTASGRDVTKCFLDGANETLKMAKKWNAAAIILKDNSPSCGSSFIYDGSFSGNKTKGNGVTAALLKREGFTVKADSDQT